MALLPALEVCLNVLVDDTAVLFAQPAHEVLHIKERSQCIDECLFTLSDDLSEAVLRIGVSAALFHFLLVQILELEDVFILFRLSFLL